MPESPVQIFISYAWRDNQPPPEDPHAKGFVTALHEQLDYQFSKLGPPEPAIWWDQTHVERGDQFDPLIKKAIDQSSMFVVVLSRRWPTRSYCLKELELFRRRWAHLDDFNFLHRITVVKINEVNAQDCPRWVLGQNPYTFYKLIGKKEIGDEYLFFERGKGNDAFYENVGNLGTYLWKRARQIARRDATDTADPDGDTLSASPGEVQNLKDASKVPKVYLAAPATDMRGSYNRLVEELKGWHYRVVPDPSADIPLDAADAVKFFDEALAGADVSIHLLGDKFGVAPDGEQPIAKLQLARAAVRLENAAAGFRRIVWAPKVLGEADGKVERDPLAVMDTFGPRRDGDVIVADSLSKFVDFLGPHLAQMVRKPAGRAPLKNGSKIYLYHKNEDAEYANILATLLQQRQMVPIPTEHDGAPDELIRFHRDCLRKCDSVVICWAAAPAVSARAMWSELDDWEGFGREKGFLRRGMVVGPPPGPRKKNYKVLFPIDESNEVVIDLTSHPQPLPEDLNPLFPSA